MLKSATFAAATAIALFMGASAHAQDVTASTVVASVNGTDITFGEMIIVRAQLPQQYDSLPADVLFEGILDQIIQQQLLADTLEHEPARLTLALANEHRSLRAGEVIDTITSAAASDEAVQAAYDARFASMEPVKEYHAAHILLDTEEEAIEAREVLDDGAEFAGVARERSTGPSGPAGGDLGWFGAGMMVPEFETAVMGMAVGDVSAPVQTQFGWHLITLYETRIQEAPSLESLRAELESEVLQAAIETRITELTDASEITKMDDAEIDPALLSNLDLLSQ